MSDFTTNAPVLAILGSYIASATIDATEVDGYITDESGEMVDMVGGVFVPFNDIGDTPATPKVVESIALDRVVARSLRELASTGNRSVLRRSEELYQKAEAKLDRLLDKPAAWMRPERKTGASITFGASNDLPFKLRQWEATIDITGTVTATGYDPNILADTLRLTGGTVAASADFVAADIPDFRNGRDFLVDFSTERGAWILSAFDSRLYNDITSLTAAYLWDYRLNEGARGARSPVLRGRF